MVKSFTTLETADTPVFQTASLLRAAAACDQLEGGGIPALLRQPAVFSVDVPAKFADQARDLLFAPPGRGEIYFYQG
jgi:hypothetical protein